MSDTIENKAVKLSDLTSVTQLIKDYTDEKDTNKVDKIEGKSLLDDTEIERLKGVNNYDDTEVKENIAEVKTDVTKLSSQIDEIANKGTTVETVQNKVKELAESGEIQAYAIADKSINAGEKIADGTITKELLSNNAVGVNNLDDSLKDCLKLSNNSISKYFYKTDMLGTNSFINFLYVISQEIDISGEITELKFNVADGDATVYLFEKKDDILTPIFIENMTNDGTNTFILNNIELKKEGLILGIKANLLQNSTLLIDNENLKNNYNTTPNDDGTFTITGLSNQKRVLNIEVKINSIYQKNINAGERIVDGTITKELLSSNAVGVNNLDDNLKDCLKLSNNSISKYFYKTDMLGTNSFINFLYVIAQEIDISGEITELKFNVADGDATVYLFEKKDNILTPIFIENMTNDGTNTFILNNIELKKEGLILGIKANLLQNSTLLIDNENLKNNYDVATNDDGTFTITGLSNQKRVLNIEVKITTEIDLKNKINSIYNQMNKNINTLAKSVRGKFEDEFKRMDLVWWENFKTEKENWRYLNCSVNTEDTGITLSGYSKAHLDLYLTFNTFRQKVNFILNDIESIFGICTDCTYSTDGGALYLIDGVNKKINIYGNYKSTETPPDDIKNSISIEDGFLEIGKKYTLDVIKKDWYVRITLIKVSTNESITVDYQGSDYLNSTYYPGHGWGGPGVISFKGSVKFDSHKYWLPCFPYVKCLFMGDSITEGVHMGKGVSVENRYSVQLKNKFFNFSAIMCGRGMGGATELLKRLNDIEKFGLKPEVIHILIGTNDRMSVTNWKNKIVEIRDKIINMGAIPIIGCPPFAPDYTENIITMRDFILEKGWDTIRYDLATSKNGEGLIQDGSLFTDGLHPNLKGAISMTERAEQDLSNIL